MSMIEVSDGAGNGDTVPTRVTHAHGEWTCEYELVSVTFDRAMANRVEKMMEVGAAMMDDPDRKTFTYEPPGDDNEAMAMESIPILINIYTVGDLIAVADAFNEAFAEFERDDDIEFSASNPAIRRLSESVLCKGTPLIRPQQD